MFLVKSGFWLTVAFIAIHPGGADVGATATALTNQAMAAGQQIVIEQMLKSNCPLGQCGAARPAVATAATSSSPSVGLTMQGSSALRSVPIPRPRPDWMG